MVQIVTTKNYYDLCYSCKKNCVRKPFKLYEHCNRDNGISCYEQKENFGSYKFYSLIYCKGDEYIINESKTYYL